MNTPKSTKPPVNPITQSSKVANRAYLLSAVAFVIAILAGLLAFWFWHTSKDIASSVRASSTRLQKNIGDNRSQLSANQRALQSQIENQQKQILMIQGAVEQVIKSSYNQEKERALSQTSYLVHLANLHLSIGHDAQTSKRLLTMAQQRLKTLNDPSLFMLKHSLSRDINNLKNTPIVDVSNIIIKLDSISKTIQSISSQPKNFQMTDSAKKQANMQKNLPWYKKILNELSGLKDLVIIRDNRRPVVALLSPAELTLMKGNIQSKLSQAEWAVLHQNPILYKESLTVAKNWLATYFSEKSDINTIIQQVDAISKIDIKPTLPNISDSLSAVNASMAHAFSLSPSAKTKKSSSKPNTKETPTHNIQKKPSSQVNTNQNNPAQGVAV